MTSTPKRPAGAARTARSSGATRPARKGIEVPDGGLPPAATAALLRAFGHVDQALDSFPGRVGAEVARALAVGNMCARCGLARAHWDYANADAVRLAWAKWASLPEGDRPDFVTLLPEALQPDPADPGGEVTGRMPYTLAKATTLDGTDLCERHLIAVADEQRAAAELESAVPAPAARQPHGQPPPGEAQAAARQPALLVTRPGVDLNAAAQGG